VSDQLVQALLLLLVFALPGVTVGARMLHRVRQLGGRVQTRALGLPDLLVSFVLCGFFGMLVVSSGLHGEAPAGRPVQVLNTDQIPSSIFFFLGCVGLLLGFLRLRRIPIAEFFGLRRWPLWRAALVGALLVAAVFPLLIGLSSLMQGLLQEAAKEQDVVTLYRQVVEAGNRRTLGLLVFVAIIFQPIVEEIIFRGYFYAVFKGWAGALASAIFTATLFATIHLSLAAWPPLLVLALALTLAYEWSGSLLVPIAMHMAFNGTQLAILTWGQKYLSP
jgi:membrane protease YdiL (CAAX protease family)